jgi:hypothetical protein
MSAESVCGCYVRNFGRMTALFVSELKHSDGTALHFTMTKLAEVCSAEIDG